MALRLTPAMESFVDAVDRLLAEDPTGLSDLCQLGNTEMLLTQRNRIDHALTGYVNAMWSSEATVERCGKSVKHWLIEEQHLAPADAGATVATARELLHRDGIDQAFAAGDISLGHAKSLTQTLRKLPAELQDVAEKELVEASRHCDPASVGKACRQLIEQLDLNEDADARYARLYGTRYLKTATTIDGMTRLDAMLDPVTAAALKAALTSLSAKQGADDERSKPQRDHDALAAILGRALRAGDLPEHGGQPPQIVVTVPLDELVYGLDSVRVPFATVDGQPLPPSAVRRLACDAGVIPAVLGRDSEVLDLGRTSRTWSKAQRLAARLRDGDTCTWPGGCTTPIRYCELHHLNFWAEHHGTTDHHNSAHICGFHHWLVHNRDWTLWRDTTGTLQCRRT